MTYTDEEIDEVLQRAEEVYAEIAVEVADLYRWVFGLAGVLAGLIVGVLIVGIGRWLA